MLLRSGFQATERHIVWAALGLPSSARKGVHMNPIEQRLASVLSRHWWLLLLRGLVAIAFGVLTWVQPGISLAALVILFGAYSMADGILATWTAIAGGKDNDYRWVLLLEGLLGIGIGVLTFFSPGITALALVFYIAIWAIATGVLEIAAAIRLREEIKNEWLSSSQGLPQSYSALSSHGSREWAHSHCFG
jgi:uncharacterized membrane protein HdeD (DUF308 family)